MILVIVPTHVSPVSVVNIHNKVVKILVAISIGIILNVKAFWSLWCLEGFMAGSKIVILNYLFFLGPIFLFGVVKFVAMWLLNVMIVLLFVWTVWFSWLMIIFILFLRLLIDLVPPIFLCLG